MRPFACLFALLATSALVAPAGAVAPAALAAEGTGMMTYTEDGELTCTARVAIALTYTTDAVQESYSLTLGFADTEDCPVAPTFYLTGFPTTFFGQGGDCTHPTDLSSLSCSGTLVAGAIYMPFAFTLDSSNNFVLHTTQPLWTLDIDVSGTLARLV